MGDDEGPLPPEEEERRRPEPFGPVDLARAVFSWIVAAILTLITVWLLVFAATRGDELGFAIGVGVLAVLALVTVIRRRC